MNVFAKCESQANFPDIPHACHATLEQVIQAMCTPFYELDVDAFTGVCHALNEAHDLPEASASANDGRLASPEAATARETHRRHLLRQCVLDVYRLAQAESGGETIG